MNINICLTHSFNNQNKVTITENTVINGISYDNNPVDFFHKILDLIQTNDFIIIDNKTAIATDKILRVSLIEFKK